MLKHEARLIDPDQAAIAAALTAATAGANKRCRARLLADDPAKWRKCARAVLGSAEGYDMFRGGRGGIPASQVLAAWWTDAIGRKHVVLRGRRVEHDEARRLLHKDELDARPPLLHAYPEYVCRRFMNGVEQIVCACGCGAVGTPDSLSWMGPMCGPCFDRQEELGPDGLRANVPGVLHGDREPLRGVACSPDGSRVAAIEGDTRVTYWDIAKRARTTMHFPGVPIAGLVFTSDGRHLAVCGSGFGNEFGLFAAFDLSADPPARVEPLAEDNSSVRGLCALPDPGEVLVARFPAEASLSVERVRLNGEVVCRAAAPAGAAPPFALSPDGTRFVTGGHRPTVVDAKTLRPIGRIHNSGSYGAVFSHDGARVFAERNGALAAYDAATGAEVIGPHRRRLPVPDYNLAVAVDPGGRFLYSASQQTGLLFVIRADALDLHAAFDWHLGPITGLAVSAAGTTLFSAGGDGCVKVWPIRDLVSG